MWYSQNKITQHFLKCYYNLYILRKDTIFPMFDITMVEPTGILVCI